LVGLRLSGADRARIHEALRDAQARTHARLALMILPVSDRYAMYPIAWAGVFALVTSGLLALSWQGIGLWAGFFIEAAIFGIVAFWLDVLPFRLMFVPNRLKRERARSMAHREFGAAILSAQDHNGGVLLFASLGERYVEIIADRIVHAEVGQDAWDKIVREFSARAKQGPVAEAFVWAIGACADKLGAHFPKPDPTEAHA